MILRQLTSIIHISIVYYYIVAKCFDPKFNWSLGKEEAEKSSSNLEVIINSAFILFVLLCQWDIKRSGFAIALLPHDITTATSLGSNSLLSIRALFFSGLATHKQIMLLPTHTQAQTHTFARARTHKGRKRVLLVGPEPRCAVNFQKKKKDLQCLVRTRIFPTKLMTLDSHMSVMLEFLSEEATVLPLLLIVPY